MRALASYRAQRDEGALSWADADVLAALERQRGDLRDPEAMERLVAGREVVFHLAALVAIPYSYANPRVVFDVNVTGTLNVALAARDAGVRRLVHTSTSEVYGTAQEVPITEAHPISAQSPYAASKASADQLVMSFHRSYGFRRRSCDHSIPMGPVNRCGRCCRRSWCRLSPVVPFALARSTPGGI